MVLEAQQQFRAQSRGIQPVTRPVLEPLQAQARGDFELVGLDGFEDAGQRPLAVAGLAQALAQGIGRVGLEQIAVERRLGGLGHLGVVGLAGDHHEHRGVGQQLSAPQVVEQVLAGVRRAGEVLLAQHDVEPARLQRAAGVGHAAGLRDGAHAEVPQLGREDAARSRVGVDD